MTKVTYTLANGTKVSTMAEALASGQPYKTSYEPIVKKVYMTESREPIANKNWIMCKADEKSALFFI